MLPCDWDNVAHVATHYRLHGPGLEAHLWRNFLYPAKTGPDVHAAFRTMSIGSHIRQKNGRGVVLTTHHHLAPRIQDQTCTSTPLWAFVACSRANITWFIFITLICTTQWPNLALDKRELSARRSGETTPNWLGPRRGLDAVQNTRLLWTCR